MKTANIQELFVEEIRDLYDAEKQLVKALPKMAKAASDPELENAFRQHLEQTREQVQRLEQVFELMDQRARSKPCHGMRGLVEEGQEIMGEDLEAALLDSALTGAGRKVEHYEMAGYEEARSMAQLLGLKEAAQLLQQTLAEELETDRRLARLSKRLGKEASRGAAETSRESRGRSSSSRSGSSRSNRSARGGSARGGSARGGSANVTTDHEQIQQWAEERGAHPACVRGTGGKGDTGMIRLDFPGYSGAQSLQPISWDEWFEKFDENNLALLYQEKTARGQRSNFNKLVSRETAQSRPKARTAR
jgi:ferritin-like metal-binding protein YciE